MADENAARAHDKVSDGAGPDSSDARRPVDFSAGIADASVFDGTDENSRKVRRAWRERLNARENRKLVIGVLATLFGGVFWGFSGTCASLLFDGYHVDTEWLMSVRQLLAGLLFMATILITDRKRFMALLHNKHDRRLICAFAMLGVLLNQYGYLMAVRLTNAGTATVMQCLQLVIIMAYSCMTAHRRPRKREIAGVILAFSGTFFIATGGDPTTLAIPAEGLVVGLLSAVGAACMTIMPARILPMYGSAIVTGSGMMISGVVTCVVFQPWRNVPALDASGWGAFAVLVVVGSYLAYMLYMQGVKDIGSMRASLIGTVEPVSATVTSALFLGTVFAGTDILGFALIIAMMFLTV